MTGGVAQNTVAVAAASVLVFDEQHALIAGYAASPLGIPRRIMDETGVDGISRYETGSAPINTDVDVTDQIDRVDVNGAAVE